MPITNYRWYQRTGNVWKERHGSVPKNCTAATKTKATKEKEVPNFSFNSLKHLSTCHPDLQRLFAEVVKQFDCTIIQGYRTKEEQAAAYESGASKLQYPQSKHNVYPSKAIDVAPWYPTEPHIDWNNRDNFHLFAGYVLGTADRLGIKVRWGGDWDGDTDTRDNTWDDLVHWELVE